MQPMIRLTLKGLAKYIASSPAAQRKILQEFKYPAADEPFAMRVYYDKKEAIVERLGGHPVAIALAADVSYDEGGDAVLDALKARKGFYLRICQESSVSLFPILPNTTRS